MPGPKLKTVTRTQGNNQALKDGTVKPKTFEFDFVEVDPLIAAFRRMVRGNEFDICEMAITTYICAKAHGKPMTAIPVFLVRAFHHGAILVNTKAGIASPRTSKASGSASTVATPSPPASGRAACCRASTASTSARSPGCSQATSMSPNTGAGQRGADGGGQEDGGHAGRGRTGRRDRRRDRLSRRQAADPQCPGGRARRRCATAAITRSTTPW